MRCYKSDIEDEYWRGEKIAFLPISYVRETADLLIISKPPFMSTHPTGKHLFHCATIQIERDHHLCVYGVHRLDRETSGLLLFPKTQALTNALNRSFETGEVKKCYFFIAHKNPPATPFPLVATERLERLSDRIATLCFAADNPRGKPAHTEFQCIFEDQRFVIGLAFPQTGRQHQIRAHAAHHGYPLLGDKIYHGGLELFFRFKDHVAANADHDLMQIPRHALHALNIAFPYHQDLVSITDQLPQDLLAWMAENIDCDLKLLTEKIMRQVADYARDFKKL